MGRRVRENFDLNWAFRRGGLDVRPAVKAGMTGGYADVPGGHWRKTNFSPERPPAASLDPQEWVPLHLPHDWCVEGDYLHDDRLGARPGYSGYLRGGVGFYRKEFPALPADRGQRCCVEFDGVMRKATVWLNGFLMGSHFGGYTGFSCDVTDVIRREGEAANVILVRVDSDDYEGWWYDGAGIYRHVWLLTTDPLHVDRHGTYITTPHVDARRATIRVRTTVRNDYASDRGFELVSTVVDPGGEQCERAAVALNAAAGTTVEADQTIELRAPQLWSPDAPSVYRVLTEVVVGKETVDTYETTFGMRTVEFSGDGFYLNGKRTVIKGTCNHQDFAGVGIAVPDSVNEHRIRLLKEMGCNAYRAAHHPPTPELLDACDSLGMLVMDENRKLDSSPQGLENLRAMVLRDRNHPSVILWSMENEETLEGTAAGARVLRTLAAATRRMDPTRPVTAAMNHGWNDGGYSDLLDVVGYNYGQVDGRYVKDHEDHPERRFVVSEMVAYPTTRGVYERDKARSYCSSYYDDISQEELGAFAQPEIGWNDIVGHPHLCGIFAWCGFDYRGEPYPYKWPNINSHFGFMDTCGFPKDIYFYFKSVWTDEPMVHVLPHWNWPGREGRAIDVWVFSNCERVELALNEASLGSKKVRRGYHEAWQVPYSPGKLAARGYVGSRLACETTVQTAGEPYTVRLEADRTELKADKRDTAVIRVAVVDEKGRVVPTADDEVLFAIDGPGRILGVGNGDPSSHEPDKSNRRRAFNGRCLALVQAGSVPGTVTLRAAANGLLSAELTLRTR